MSGLIEAVVAHDVLFTVAEIIQGRCEVQTAVALDVAREVLEAVDEIGDDARRVLWKK